MAAHPESLLHDVTAAAQHYACAVMIDQLGGGILRVPGLQAPPHNAAAIRLTAETLATAVRAARRAMYSAGSLLDASDRGALAARRVAVCNLWRVARDALRDDHPRE